MPSSSLAAMSRPVAGRDWLRKILRSRRSSKRETADQGASLPDFFAQGTIAPWIDDVDSGPQHAKGDSLRRERAAVCRAVYADGETAGYDKPASGEIFGELM